MRRQLNNHGEKVMITIRKETFEAILSSGVKNKQQLFQEAEKVLEANPKLKDFPYTINSTYKIFVPLFKDGREATYENISNSDYYEPGTPYATFKIWKTASEVELSLELNCRNIEGSEEILDRELDERLIEIKERAFFIRETIASAIEDLIGVKNESIPESGSWLDEILNPEYSNDDEIREANEKALKKVGFDVIRGEGYNVEYLPENQNHLWAKLTVDISDRGHDDFGDVCSNVGQVTHLFKIRL